jgi:CRP-like cAMP-binding protein
MSSRNLLPNVYLFQSLTEQELDAVAKLAEVEPFAAGDTIFLKGEAAKALYLIKHGTIRIQQGAKNGDQIDVATLSAGSHFGEMAFVDGEARSATATASDRGEIFILPYEKLNVLLKQNASIAVKFYRELSHFLAGRLRKTTSDLSFAKEHNVRHF